MNEADGLYDGTEVDDADGLYETDEVDDANDLYGGLLFDVCKSGDIDRLHSLACCDLDPKKLVFHMFDQGTPLHISCW